VVRGVGDAEVDGAGNIYVLDIGATSLIRREWWTRYTPDFSRLRVPSLAFYALPASPPLPPNRPAD
jgi:hypothetical protein